MQLLLQIRLSGIRSAMRKHDPRKIDSKIISLADNVNSSSVTISRGVLVIQF